MMNIGVDDHPSSQQFAHMDQETGECGERRLNHGDGEGESFYRELKQRGVSVCVGMEATGYSRWFERLLAGRGSRRGLAMRRRSRRCASGCFGTVTIAAVPFSLIVLVP
jgi:hypothetical protein